ncbi:helix-turn-helix protein [Rhizobium azibense]|uniref:Helix-turn-helix protein n=1 Tax=Rhizobium azibense TaxID=1136135 RepID=A0A4R3RTK3_9HYPH|nr:helix-turn-helix protein [Rhizobium azibense]
MTRAYSQIDMDERRKIARWRAAGLSATVIAEKLGRHRSTIFRELNHPHQPKSQKRSRRDYSMFEDRGDAVNSHQ